MSQCDLALRKNLRMTTHVEVINVQLHVWWSN